MAEINLNFAEELRSITFDGDALLFAEFCSDAYVLMRPVLEAIGLDKESEEKRIEALFGDDVARLKFFSYDKTYREEVCLTLFKFDAWLYQLNPVGLTPDQWEKVVRYRDRFGVTDEIRTVRMGIWQEGVPLIERVDGMLRKTMEIADRLPDSGVDYGLDTLFISLSENMRAINGYIPRHVTMALMGVLAGLMIHAHGGKTPREFAMSVLRGARK